MGQYPSSALAMSEKEGSTASTITADSAFEVDDSNLHLMLKMNSRVVDLAIVAAVSFSIGPLFY